jgi:hypothetical protein
MTISGIGDNFQLHTLLAATLIGDPARGLIPGTPPHPAWFAAATDGEMAPPGGIRGQFNLVDATGEWIWNEGRPADIPSSRADASSSSNRHPTNVPGTSDAPTR